MAHRDFTGQGKLDDILGSLMESSPAPVAETTTPEETQTQEQAVEEIPSATPKAAPKKQREKAPSSTKRAPVKDCSIAITFRATPAVRERLKISCIKKNTPMQDFITRAVTDALDSTYVCSDCTGAFVMSSIFGDDNKPVCCPACGGKKLLHTKN